MMNSTFGWSGEFGVELERGRGNKTSIQLSLKIKAHELGEKKNILQQAMELHWTSPRRGHYRTRSWKMNPTVVHRGLHKDLNWGEASEEALVRADRSEE